jgi:2'-5' RNA ligase
VESDLRTALIVSVAGLPDVIDRWRERTCAFKPSAGVPPHITLVFPFVPAAQATDSLVSELSELVRECACFTFDLGELRRFSTTLYLAPEPSEPFVALSEALADRYPDCAPQVHAFGEVVPHLTVAEGSAELMEAASNEIQPLLPIRTSCESATLLVEASAHPTHWSARASLPLRRASEFWSSDCLPDRSRAVDRCEP